MEQLIETTTDINDLNGILEQIKEDGHFTIENDEHQLTWIKVKVTDTNVIIFNAKAMHSLKGNKIAHREFLALHAKHF